MSALDTLRRFRRATAHLTSQEKIDLAEKLEAIAASDSQQTPEKFLAALLEDQRMPSKVA
jgi:hypothetical protein